MEKVRQSYQGQQYDIQVYLRPWPQCEVLTTLERALKVDDKPVISIAGGKYEFQESEVIFVEIAILKWSSYLYISYIQFYVSVVHMQQPHNQKFAPILSRTFIKFVY